MLGASSTDPQHYKRDGVDMECIDAIRAALTPDGFRYYCAGNTMKYLWRMFDADRSAQKASEDAQKAAVYAKWIADSWNDTK
tara:strand:- start:201 stop:446 length:246 start_codon:yes stop_codon:yes gene_type:complete